MKAEYERSGVLLRNAIYVNSSEAQHLGNWGRKSVQCSAVIVMTQPPRLPASF